jgi:transposase
MIAVPAGVRILVASRPVDFRNGLDGLAARVQQALHENPFAGDLFVFRAKRADRIKILAWDGTGLCLFHKRLEKGHFIWPPVQDGAIRLSTAQLALLLEGLDWSRVRSKPVTAPLLAGGRNNSGTAGR